MKTSNSLLQPSQNCSLLRIPSWIFVSNLLDFNAVSNKKKLDLFTAPCSTTYISMWWPQLHLYLPIAEYNNMEVPELENLHVRKKALSNNTDGKNGYAFEQGRRLGCGVVYILCEPMFRRNVSPPSSSVHAISTRIHIPHLHSHRRENLNS
jgi:hypothetical protein